MAREELRWPVLATAVAAGAFVFHATRSADRTSPMWFFVVPALACFVATFFGWVRCRRKILALEDAPLSKIASAAQGYVRLEGRAALFPGNHQVSPLTGQACCWYSYVVTRDRADKKGVVEIEHDTSIWSFALQDGSGEAVVDPQGARLVCLRVRTWSAEDFHYTHRCILPGDPVFVLGDYRTAREEKSEYEVQFAVGLLLAEWKKDMPSLLARFDAGGDGRLDGAEWEAVGLAARREVLAEMATANETPQNRVAKPSDGRAFIISADSRDHLRRDLAIWSWIHLTAFVVGIPVLVHLATQG
jgi:hypothetical protein